MVCALLTIIKLNLKLEGVLKRNTFVSAIFHLITDIVLISTSCILTVISACWAIILKQVIYLVVVNF